MSVFLRALIVIAAAGAISFPAAPPEIGKRRGVAPAGETRTLYQSTDLEQYLTEEGLAYIRPGLNIRITNVTIPADRRPLVEFTLTDDLNQPLDRLGQVTPGAISLNWVLARWDQERREYFGITSRVQTAPTNSPRPGAQAFQVAADSGGTTTDLGVGRGTYKFRTPLPENFDPAKTYTIGIYSTRNLTAILGKNYFANLEHDFRPDGQAVVETWDKIHAKSATCNNCHDPLGTHGGSRRDIKLCVMCHTSQTIDPDTGNTVDMETLIHKIHYGVNLPSVQAGTPYVIIGNAQSVHDFSHVVFPQDTRNCANCHEGITAAQRASQAHLWFTNPTKHACFACHDNIDLETGEGHPGGAQADDSRCSSCHVPDSGSEFDASVMGAHVIPEKSSQLQGLKAEIISVTNAAPGQRPTVVVRLTDNAGNAVNGATIATFAPMIAGPTTSYRRYFRETAGTRATFDPATGNTTYTFTAAIPADATGSWGASGDFARLVTIQGNNNQPTQVREAAFNPIRYFRVSGTGNAEPRRIAVAIQQCNVCHDRLAFHGGNRLNTEECVMCHNPVETDAARRPADQQPPESVSFQRLIHRVHRGTELTQDFTVYGFGNTPHNYNHVEFPGDLRNCAKCHTNNSQQVPGRGDAVATLRDYFTPQPPTTAACLGCHDSEHAAAHAFLNIVMFPGRDRQSEACATCHGPNADQSVDRVHAR